MMGKLSSLFLWIFFSFCVFHGGIALDGQSEEWGYVEVRPKAHMFWWRYTSPHRDEHPPSSWPTILWLQGGPGGSGIGIGNFLEIGPLDTDLKPRNSTWLNKADLLFVDNPVGTGYSYVEDSNLFVKSDEAAATDLTTLLMELYNKNESLQQSPLYIVAESYGGKFAVTTALSILKAIDDGKLNLTLGGVALGNSWISPEDFVLSYGPLLKDVSRLDNIGLEKSNSLANKIKQLLRDGNFSEATDAWRDLEELIGQYSNNVDFYNFLQDNGMGPIALSASESISNGDANFAVNRYSTYLSSLRVSLSAEGGLQGLMDGSIKKKLKIIPPNVTWGGQSGEVFYYLSTDFMKPRIAEVDELLSKGVNVTIYNGQLDVICATKGVESWVEKLKWDGLKDFLNSNRTALYCEEDKDQITKGFIKSYKNLRFYWILDAGHFVPVSQPCVSLDMAAAITQSPTTY